MRQSTTGALTPLFRQSVGFDPMLALIDGLSARSHGGDYPPYNIIRHDDDQYEIQLAVAGFSHEDLDIQASGDSLVVRASGGNKEDTPEGPVYLHRGIAGRGFEKRFHLANHIRVEGAGLDRGILSIALKREVPECLKPRSIAIASGPASS